ncbi:MAG: hypothetical protein Q4F84_10765 [Fibrobacter sp.]|nr:hypothetical protein [Fibrobacter sp.]
MGQKDSAFTRKHFFIDKNFQGRYMMTFLIPMLVLLAFMLFTLYFASHAIIKTSTRIIKNDIENRIALELQDQSEPTVIQYEAAFLGIKDYLRTFSNNKEFRKNLMNSLLLVFGVGVLLVIIQVVLLTIFFSHKIAGPVYRFENVFHNIINGNYTDQIKLRRGDEMKNLAVLFNEALRLTRLRMITLKDKNSPEFEEISSFLKI